jgi:uncharacterized protein YjbK
MQKPVERELKILLTKEQYEKILHSYDFDEIIHQSNQYFDTPQETLKNNQIALRLRTKNDKIIFTLKKRKDATAQIELEKEADASSLNDIQDQQILDWMKEYQIERSQLLPSVCVSTIRHFKKLPNAELCLDEQTFENGEHDYELEYEYTKEHNGIEEFNQILAPLHLAYEKNCPTKVARAVARKN